MIYIVIGTEGEYSAREVWIAGAYTDKATAISAAEAQKRQDRTEWLLWRKWNDEFGRRIEARPNLYWWPQTASFKGITREDSVKLLDMYPEPPQGHTESEYSVACVPLNQMGRWDYTPDE